MLSFNDDININANDAATDTDVVMASGRTRRRSLVAIGAVFVALCGAAIASSKRPSSAPTAAATTTVAATSISPTTALTATTATTSDRSIGPGPLLGEKTGITLMLVRVRDIAGGQSGSDGWHDSILDLDTGTIHVLGTATTDASREISLHQVANGVAAVLPGDGIVRFWDATGRTRDVAVATDTQLVGKGDRLVIGNDLWMIDYSASSNGASPPRLASLNLSSGTWSKSSEIPTWSQLVGWDNQHRPVITTFSGGGSYSYDAKARQFSRLTTADVVAAAGDGLLTSHCDEHLSCQIQFESGTQKSPLPSAAGSRFDPFVLAPAGHHIVALRPAGDSDTRLVEVFDTSTYEHAVLGRVSDSTRLAWSSDGRWLFAQLQDGLVAWRSGLAAPIRLQRDGVPIEAEAVAVFAP